MQKWEYKIVKLKIDRFFDSDIRASKVENLLNEHGANGWELVNVFDLNMDKGKSSIVVATMKRVIQE